MESEELGTWLTRAMILYFSNCHSLGLACFEEDIKRGLGSMERKKEEKRARLAGLRMLGDTLET